MNNAVTYAKLKNLLQSLGFKENILPSHHIVFSCGDEKKMLIYRAYRHNEELDWNDVAKTRRFLDAWGMVEEDAFDNLLQETAA